MRRLWLALALALGLSACARTAAPRMTTLADARTAALVVAVDAGAGRSAQAACTAHDLGGVTEFWKVSADSIAAFDRRVVQRTDSLFAQLRQHPRFRQLGAASDYHRQYLGIWHDGRPLVYVHGTARAAVQQVALRTPNARVDEHLIALCDAGLGVIGLLLDPQSGVLGRLEFSGGFAGRLAYDEIVPPSPADQR